MGRPHTGWQEFINLTWKLARQRDTLHLLAFALRQQASKRGDVVTVALIDDTLRRLSEGDKIKQELIKRMK